MENGKEQFMEHVTQSIAKNTFIKITFGKYRGDDKEFKNIFVKRIVVKDEDMLSFTFRYDTKDIVKNYNIERSLSLINEITGKDFLSATLFTTDHDISLDYSKKRVAALHVKKPTGTSAPVQTHNNEKSRFVNPDAKYFYRLGITTIDGKVRADKYDKFRQVDKFIEIIDSLHRASNLKDKDEIKIFDMGSGKSYMTFALYDYFTKITGKKITVTGIELRDELVNLSNRIADECGYTGLKFVKGSIEDITIDEADVCVALHACDTATDDALAKSVKANAEIIVLAPCCQKYLRKKMKLPARLNLIFNHGIMLEQVAVMLTDGLRALVLEHFGYETKVFEFISSEHTSKNSMITGVRKSTDLHSRLDEITAIKEEFQIEDFYLDTKLLN